MDGDAEILERGFETVLETLALASHSSFPLTELTEEELFWDSRILHASDMACPPELCFPQCGVYAGESSLFQDLSVRDFVLPSDVQEVS